MSRVIAQTDPAVDSQGLHVGKARLDWLMLLIQYSLSSNVCAVFCAFAATAHCWSALPDTRHPRQLLVVTYGSMQCHIVKQPADAAAGLGHELVLLLVVVKVSV